jgi:CDP-paratose 2-epimerase
VKILVTGGAGFIGSNTAYSFAKAGHKVTIVDNLSRKGSEENYNWLMKENNIHPIITDIRNKFGCEVPDVIFHFAAQTGVIPSVKNPIEDFSVNAMGTLQLLESFKEKKPLIIYASTNKVYGEFETDKPVNESQPLSFCTPYGCSKGTADQYILDYFRIYSVPTVVLRMSCIYGNRQLGNEEENGWLCHFAKNKDNPITVYGDGTQVRDALYIDDYVALMHTLVERRDHVQGEVFNIGGGIDNAVSVNDVLKKLGNTNVTYSDWRPNDQRYYVSDISKITEYTGWKPTIGIDEGLERLKEWTNQL